MDSQQIENLANLDKVGNGLDIQLLLRTVVIQEFMADVGDAKWRRTNTTMALAQGDNVRDLPDDFHHMILAKIPGAGAGTVLRTGELAYIGENDSAVLAAEAATDRARPTGYYITSRVGDGTFRAVHFDVPCDAAYTLYYIYLRSPVFPNSEDAVNFSAYMPELYQGGLVKCLRKAILIDRVGEDDPRYTEALGEYRTWIKMRINPDQAQRRYIKTVN